MSQFILIGIVLLISVFVITYIRETNLLFRPSVIMPANVWPVSNFIEECIEDQGTEALIIAGQQSGYINMPDYIAFNPASIIGTFTTIFSSISDNSSSVNSFLIFLPKYVPINNLL